MTVAKVLRFLFLFILAITSVILVFSEIDTKDINDYLIYFITTKTAGIILAIYTYNQFKKHYIPSSYKTVLRVQLETRDGDIHTEVIPLLPNKSVDGSIKYYIVDNYPMWSIAKYIIIEEVREFDS